MTPNHAHRDPRYLPPANPPRESWPDLLFAALALLLFCAAWYVLVTA